MSADLRMFVSLACLLAGMLGAYVVACRFDHKPGGPRRVENERPVWPWFGLGVAVLAGTYLVAVNW